MDIAGIPVISGWIAQPLSFLEALPSWIKQGSRGITQNEGNEEVFSQDIYTYVYIHIHKHTHRCTYTYIGVYMYIHIHIYIYTYEQYFRKKKNISKLLGGITAFYLFVLEHFVLLLWQTCHN